MIGGMEGFQPEGRVDSVGAQTVFRLRLKYGVPHKELADWTRYYDDLFYLEYSR